MAITLLVCQGETAYADHWSADVMPHLAGADPLVPVLVKTIERAIWTPSDRARTWCITASWRRNAEHKRTTRIGIRLTTAVNAVTSFRFDSSSPFFSDLFPPSFTSHSFRTRVMNV